MIPVNCYVVVDLKPNHLGEKYNSVTKNKNLITFLVSEFSKSA